MVVLLPSCSTDAQQSCCLWISGPYRAAVMTVILLTKYFLQPPAQRLPDQACTCRMMLCTHNDALSCMYLPYLSLLISRWSQWSRSLTSLGCCWKKAAQTYGGKLYSRARSTGSTGPAHPAALECAPGCGQHTVTMTTVKPH